MQLTKLYPRCHRRFSSLPILGPIVEGYAIWLFGKGYPRHRVRVHVRKTRVIDAALGRRGVLQLEEVTRADLGACRPACSQDDADLTGAVHSLIRFLDERVLLPLRAPPTRSAILVDTYAAFLRANRGLQNSTVTQHSRTAAELLEHVGYENEPERLSFITPDDLDAFICAISHRLTRESLQHEVAHVRAFTRFLAGEGLTPPGLDTQIDTPRVYRLERLPRGLPWKTVQDFLNSIERTTPLGQRDYTIFFLIATYGLRASEIVDLRLDDIDWRRDTLRVAQRKTRSPLLLPLVDSVGNLLVDYLRDARPSSSFRHLFLRARAPEGTLKPTAVTEAFQAWSKRSGLDIAFNGAHCLRHSYAIHLLRQGTPLKTIGDILGHRTAESTCVYLRLAIEDLREVALSLPTSGAQQRPLETQP